MPSRDQAHITNFPEEPLWVMNRDGISLHEVVPPTLSKALSANGCCPAVGGWVPSGQWVSTFIGWAGEPWVQTVPPLAGEEERSRLVG
jgi:hypothetical protein